MPPTFYVPELATPFQRLKFRVLDKRKPINDFPTHVQIQTVSGCNANCVFCPNKKTDLEIPLGKRMSMDLWKRIVDQLVETPMRRMSPYLMNESTMDPDLPERVKYFTGKKQSFQYSKINSHGNFMNERMMAGLLDAGLDRINFSVQGIDPVEYEKIMVLKFEKTVRNIERIIKLRDEGNYKTRIRVVMLVTTMIEPQLPAIKAFWKERGIKIHLNRLENRGKNSHIKSDEIAVRKLRTFDWCDRMFNQMYILYDGRMVMCCADWEQTSMMGDASKDSIKDIWMNSTYRSYRERYLKGEVKGMLCDGCTKDGERGDGETTDLVDS